MKVATTFLLFCLLPFTVFSQKIFFVNQATGNNTNIGLSWTDALSDLNIALQSAVSGDEIWVAKGVYLPTADSDPAASFVLKNGVRVYGGFAGTETALEERNPNSNPTVLSGNIGAPNLYNDNSYTVVTGYGLDETTVLDGFEIRDGYNGTGEGGGLFLFGSDILTNSKPLIRHCKFINNFANNGGAVRLKWTGNSETSGLVNPVFVDCEFRQNRSFEKGAGILKSGPSGPNEVFEVNNCYFFQNRCLLDEGGAFVLDFTKNTKVLFKKCIFEKDSALAGAGIAYYADAPGGFNSQLDIDSCTFISNWAIEAASIYNLDFFNTQNVLSSTIHHTTFFKNKARTNFGSAFLYRYYEGNLNLQVKQCRFEREMVKGTGICAALASYGNLSAKFDQCRFLDNGGDNYNTLAIFCGATGNDTITGISNLEVNNCLFKNNEAGIFNSTNYNARATTNIRNCTFFNNGTYVFLKTTNPAYNPIFDTYFNNMTIENCIIWEKKAAWNTLFYNNNPDNIMAYGFTVKNSMLTYDLTKLFGLPYLDTAKVYFNIYPEFIDTIGGDFHLATCSPFVNAGNTQAAIDAGLLTDLEGNPRIFDTAVDLGAYEQQDSCIESDLTPEVNIQGITIGPNPFYDRLLVQLNAAVPTADFYLYNGTGQLVRQQTLPGNTAVETSGLPGGIYFWEIQNSSKIMQRGTLVKRGD